MKKTLSILLSLLMVLGTFTCLFTMPVATASAQEAATETTVETLPVNDYITNNAVKTITPDTVFTVNNVSFPTSVSYGIRGWNAKKDDAGNIISGQENSYIDKNVYYQMTFDVTASEDINDGVTFRPVFHSNDSMHQSIAGIVGMRNDVTDPTAVETAYNLKTNVSTADKTLPTTTADNAATLVAGKTYTYTYIFNMQTDYINHIRMVAEGLTAGSVTVGEAKLFRRSETYAGNFVFTTTVVSYDVEEDGNVFTRMYGYRDIGSTATTKQVVNAKVGGDLYNMTIVGGKTYELRFDARYNGTKGFHDDDTAGRSPAFDLYETGALNYAEAYASIKDAADEKNYNIDADRTTSQRNYSGPNNGYSYFYAGSGSATSNRRIKNNIANMSYYTADGTAIVTNKSQGYGSQSGRNIKDEINTKTWIKGVYSLDAIGAQTLEEAATAGSATSGYDKYMRYTYANGAWTFNSGYNNIYAPAAQDVTVALGIEFIYAGSVYDFDNFELVTDVKDIAVKYVDADGNPVNTAYTSHPASSYYDVATGKTIAEIKLFESDIYTFNGWFNGSQFISADTEIALDGTYDDLTAVITTKNLLTNAGGFENYSNNTSLEAAYTEVNTTNYPNYTGTASDQRRFYNARPTGDKWTGWDSSAKLNSIKDSDDGVTSAKIIADIEAAGGVINTRGFTGFTWFKNFPQVVSAKNTTIYADAGTAYGKADHYVQPYSGTKMLQMQASARTAYRALEGLTPGKTYTVSFYAYNPYAYYFLKEVAVKTSPNNDTTNYGDSKQLAYYTTPYTTVTEDVHNANGVGTSTTGIPKADADYAGKWYNISLTFKAEDTVAYLALYNGYKSFTNGYIYIDELTLVEYECGSNHIYDDLLDIDCNVCGEQRVYPSAWDFEDESMESIVNGSGTIKVVDAVGQPEKIGDKYLEYTTKGWEGVNFNFFYEQGYKYKISYDFKVFAYGTGATSNGIDHALLKNADGKYGSNSAVDNTPLNSGYDNIVTRYFEDGTPYEKVTCFTHVGIGENNFYGTVRDENGAAISMSPGFGPIEMWDAWQHFEIEIGTNNDYEGLVEYGLRPNDSGWVVGIDNFKVEKIATAAIDEANSATNGTYAFNIRAKSAEKKQGLRFKSTIDLDKLNLADGAKIVEYGTLASKATYAEQGYFLRREAANAENAKVIAGIAYNEADGTDIRYAIDETTNTLTYTGVLTGIGVKNYDVDFNVCGYAIIEAADGTRTTVYDDMVTLSVYDAAQQIITENTNADDVAVAQTVVDTYNAYLAAQ